MIKQRFFYLVLGCLCILMLKSCKEKEPENTPPVAVFTAGDNTGNIETIFKFDASGSYDLEDDASELVVRWDWQDDGIWDTQYSTEKIIRKGFGKEGFYEVRLEVKDTKGLKSDYAEIISVEELLLEDLRDNQQYSTVKIGEQIWMSENLNYNTYAGSYCHGNNTDNCTIYGRLYEWEDALSACPSGWKLPTMEDWELLIDYLGENAGSKLKSDHGWQADINGNNSSGFNALPASYLTSYGEFMNLGAYAFFWTGTERDNYGSWCIQLSYNLDYVEKNFFGKKNAFSVRCLKI